jgi:hypothetical protein
LHRGFIEKRWTGWVVMEVVVDMFLKQRTLDLFHLKFAVISKLEAVVVVVTEVLELMVKISSLKCH